MQSLIGPTETPLVSKSLLGLGAPGVRNSHVAGDQAVPPQLLEVLEGVCHQAWRHHLIRSCRPLINKPLPLNRDYDRDLF